MSYNKNYKFRGNYNNNYNRNNNNTNNNYSNNANNERLKTYGEHDHNNCGCFHGHSLLDELICHIPKALIALCIAFLFIVFFDTFISNIPGIITKSIYHNLFHICHYMHILCAAAVGILSFINISARSYILGAAFSFLTSILFCTLSDIIMPTVIGMFMGYNIDMHLCLLDLNDLMNVFIFSIAGIICGICILKNDKRLISKNINFMHLGHIFTGCLAAFSYILAQTSILWIINAGFILLTIFFAIVIPCTISDVIIPMIFYKK